MSQVTLFETIPCKILALNETGGLISKALVALC